MCLFYVWALCPYVAVHDIHTIIVLRPEHMPDAKGVNHKESPSHVLRGCSVNFCGFYSHCFCLSTVSGAHASLRELAGNERLLGSAIRCILHTSHKGLFAINVQTRAMKESSKEQGHTTTKN